MKKEFQIGMPIESDTEYFATAAEYHVYAKDTSFIVSAPSLQNVTFIWQDKSDSLRDPCVATLLALIAFAPLISIGFDYGFHPPLRMTR